MKGVRARLDLPLLGLCAGAALFAAVAHLLLFRRGSLNNDEVAYLLQAEQIARGHLFLPVLQPAEASQPWFFVERPPGFVSKYLPLVSALHAVGLVLFGSIVPVLALLAGLVPLLVHALAREVGLERRDALLAAALVSLSPVVLMESAIPLSYLPFLVLVTGCWLLLVRLGLHRAGAVSALLLGLGGMAAACARPFDAVLLLAPGLVWVARERRRELLRLAVPLVLGALPLLVAVGAYNAGATGRPWKVPFALLEPRDALGYGLRQLLPEDSAVGFGPLQALQGLGVHFGLAPLTWFALGVLLVPAAALAWRGAPAPVRVLLASVVVHLVGYGLFWGPFNFSVLWGRGQRVLGPVYTIAVLVPVVIAGLPVLRRWLARERRLRPVVAVAGLVAVAQLASAVFQAAVDDGRTDRLLDLAARAGAATPVLLDVDPPYLGHPVSGLVAGVSLAAYAPVPAEGAPLPQLLQLPRTVYGVQVLTYALTQQVRTAGPSVALDVSLVGRRADVLVVMRAGRATACRLAAQVPLEVTPEGYTGCDEEPLPVRWLRDYERQCQDASCLVVSTFREGDDGRMRRRGWRRLPVDTTASGVAVLTDGAVVESQASGWIRVAAH